jgi:putative transcriptional regulator
VGLIAEHTPEGALGLVVNRPSPATIAELWESISGETTTFEGKAYVGGPVQQNAVLFLHGHDELAAEAEPIVPGVYLGSEAELLGKVLSREAEAAPAGARLRIFCGYSGWGAGQLDREMAEDSWLTVPASAEHVFHQDPERLWTQALKGKGGVYEFFSMMPPDPEMN